VQPEPRPNNQPGLVGSEPPLFVAAFLLPVATCFSYDHCFQLKSIVRNIFMSLSAMLKPMLSQQRLVEVVDQTEGVRTYRGSVSCSLFLRQLSLSQGQLHMTLNLVYSYAMRRSKPTS
jgi:hypothetical protein